MTLVKPISSLRRSNHLQTRLELRDERVYATRLLPWLALVDISFGFVDWFSVPGSNPFYFFGLRILGVVLSRVFYLLSRGRVRYGLRLFLLVAPYIYVVEYIMIAHGLYFTPYFAGVGLVMITCTMLFPVRKEVAFVVYTACILPVLIYLPQVEGATPANILNAVLMAIGSVLVCAVNSGQVFRERVRMMTAGEMLARDLGKRKKEIQNKAEELLKRKTFETQFSPQVVSAVLRNRSMIKMSQENVSMIVIDIENSTHKANTLDASTYKSVVEEVFDVFSSACLKWNITVDKFTGDGAQAFAGAPLSDGKDYWRAIMAAKETIDLLEGRRAELDRLWHDRLNLRLAVVEGTALVGFLGRGALKSFTALGETVSLAHRFCAKSDPWTILAYSKTNKELNLSDMTQSHKTVTDLKGFGNASFQAKQLHPQASQPLTDTGRCPKCETPLVIEDDANGLPKLTCPSCEARLAA